MKTTVMERVLVIRSLFTSTCFGLAFLFFTLSNQAQAAQLLQAHLPPVAAREQPLGLLPATNSLNLAISLPLRNREALANLLREIYDPASPNYHHYLTPAEFTELFGPTEKDYQSVIRFAKAHGLKVTATHANRMLVDVSGTVKNIQQTLHVSLHTYQHPTEARTFYAPDAPPSLDLTTPVLGVAGLDNYSMPHPRYVTKPATMMANESPNADTGSGPGGTYMGADFRAAYAPDTTLTGSGQVVGLLQFDGYNASDITYYEGIAGLPNVPLQNVLIDGASGAGSGSGGQVEVSLDIEMAISMAPGLSKVIVYEAPNPSPFVDVLNRMADDDLAKQLSCSWYEPHGAAEPAADQIFLQMAAQGQSFFNASGDDDAYTGLIDFPGDSPYITQVGGTTLAMNNSGGSYNSETVWNWGGGIGSGGGISTQYPIPDWQTNINMSANQGSTTQRNTPDVAMTADNVYVRAIFHDYRNIGGTSCAAPLWAGFAALVNQQAEASGKPDIGFINPALDAIGTGPDYATCFHDITVGNNTWGGSPAKFHAVPGYDLCTGWGTPAGQRLVDALANPEPLLIMPTEGFVSAGGVGGPFTVTSQDFTLTNLGTNTISWTLANTSQWLEVSSISGTLPVGGPATSLTVSLNSAASNLVVGTYSATLWFTNVDDGVGQGRQFALNVISPPTIINQPTNQAVLEGATGTFTVSATGGMPLNYQWQFNGTNLTDGGNISGSTGTNLVISDVESNEVGLYSVVVTNLAGQAVSSNASLTITPSEPVIVMQPADQTAVVGQTVTFNVAAIGTKPFTYQWKFDDTNIDGANNVLLVLTNVQLSQSGEYSVVVSNTLGSAASSSAMLKVYPTPPALFFDDFSGPDLNSNWQASLPDAHCGSFPTGYSQIASYAGAPGYNFDVLDSYSVLNITNYMGPLQRRGWSSVTNYLASDFRYEVRFNSLTQSSSSSIDGFVEIWIMDATNSSRYDIVSPFGGGFGSDFYVFFGSSIDNSYTHTSFSYSDNTWYRLVLQCAPGQNIRASLCRDDGTELVGKTLGHDASAYGSGFKIVLSQAIGDSGTPYPDHVDVDYASLTTGLAPAITVQPQSQMALPGTNVTFSVTASGYAPLSYQWSVNNTNISWATNATMTLTNVQLADSGNYAVLVTNIYGSAQSSNAVLTVEKFPNITAQPTNQAVYAGDNVSFSVMATGTSPLSYQWLFNNTNIDGATNATLALANVQVSQAGDYAVVVTNFAGSVTSSNALLTVNPLNHFSWNSVPTPRFVNVPFTVTLTAQDPTNGTDLAFTNAVLLSATNGLAISPVISGNFTQGVWSGTVVIAQAASNVVLQADDGLGHAGLANAFNVVVRPALGFQMSSSTMLFHWPASYSAFTLEFSGTLSPTAWAVVPISPVQIGDQYVVPVQMTETNGFYRLRFSGP